MREVNERKKSEIRDLVYGYFAEECDVDRESLSDETDIIRDLEGDSLMLLALLELVRKKNGLTIELKTLGKHLMKKPANTIGQIIDLTVLIEKYGDDVVNVEL